MQYIVMQYTIIQYNINISTILQFVVQLYTTI